jgi:PilZ domain
MRDMERRRNRRFDLHYPATLRSLNGLVVEGIAENASLGGSLFLSQVAIPLGAPVDVTIALQDPAVRSEIRLHGIGKVARVQQDSGDGVRIAVVYDLPLAQD